MNLDYQLLQSGNSIEHARLTTVSELLWISKLYRNVALVIGLGRLPKHSRLIN